VRQLSQRDACAAIQHCRMFYRFVREPGFLAKGFHLRGPNSRLKRWERTDSNCTRDCAHWRFACGVQLQLLSSSRNACQSDVYFAVLVLKCFAAVLIVLRKRCAGCRLSAVSGNAPAFIFLFLHRGAWYNVELEIKHSVLDAQPFFRWWLSSYPLAC